MAQYKGIQIPEIYSPDMESSDLGDFVSTFGNSLMRSWIYGMQRKESDMLKADVNLYNSTVLAGSQYKDSSEVQDLITFLEDEQKSVIDDPLRVKYIDASLNSLDAKKYNLERGEDLRKSMQTIEGKLNVLEAGGIPGYKSDAPKLLAEFDDLMFDNEHHQSQLMKEKAKNIREEVLYSINGIDLMNTIDEDPNKEGVQITGSNYPNDESLGKTREVVRLIEEAQQQQQLTGEFDKSKYQAANKLRIESLRDRRIGSATQDRISRELKKGYVTEIHKGAEALEKAFIFPKGEDMTSVYGSVVAGLNINPNIEKIIDVGESAYSPARAEQSKNAVFHDVARMLEKSSDMPNELTKAIQNWKGDSYVVSSPYLDDVYNLVAYWKKGAIVNKEDVRAFDFPGVDFLGKEGKNTKVRDLVMRYMEFLKMMDEKHNLMFPSEEETTDDDPPINSGNWGDFFK